MSSFIPTYMLETIQANNAKRNIDSKELALLIEKAEKVHLANFGNEVWFERSIFINWTCGIADCKYCYLSTTPKRDVNAKRSTASILAEILVCKAMGWKIGYLTGGLRVESTKEMVELLENVNSVLDEKVKMNFGPYTRREVEAFAPHILGMGVAIESFDPKLHEYICPSKPLSALENTLESLKELGLKKFITIILGLGETQEDLEKLKEKIIQYDIDKVQLCFLKAQKNTVFEKVPAPDPEYMAWWIANLRVAFPKLEIKVALVRERTSDIALYLRAGMNSFSRFMAFNDVGSKIAKDLIVGCENANRKLQGHFLEMPEINSEELIVNVPKALKDSVKKKADQYLNKLTKKLTPLTL